MPWSITVGRFGGTEVKIHITFLLLLAWIAFSAWGRGGAGAALDSTLFIVLIFACVVLHEFGHILAARRYGIQTPTVTLLADRRRGQHAAPADRPAAGARRRARRARGQSRHRPRCSFWRSERLRPAELTEIDESESVARSAGSRRPISFSPSSI